MWNLIAGVVFGIVFGVGACGAVGQAFPIRAMGEAVYPDDAGVEYFEWYSGTLDRVGDVNGDGVDDLVVLFAESSKFASNRSMWLYVAVLAEDGSISFGAPERLVGFDLEGGYISDFVIHDHNGDGLNDLLLVTDQRHDLEVWINSPTGFVLGMTLHNGLDGTTEGQHILIKDIDQDGDQDYLLTEGGIWTKQTNENFTFESVDFYGSFFEQPAVISDLDGDGDLDLINLFEIYIYALKPTADGWAVEMVESELQATNFELSHRGQTFADVNGDGLEDVVVLGWSDDDNGEEGWGFGFFLAPFEIGDFDPDTYEYDELEPREIPYFVFQRFENDYSQSFFEDPDSWERTLSSPGDLDGDGTDDLIYYPFEGKTSGWQIFDPLNQNGRRAVVPAMSVHGEGKLTRDMDIDFARYIYRDAYMDINGDGVKDRLVPTIAERGVAMDVWDESDFGLMVWGVLSNPFDKRVVLDEQDAMTRWNMGSMSHVIAADLDLDDDPEILVNVGSLRLFDRDEAGLFRSPDFPRFRNARGGFLTIVAQFDSDPRPDIVTMGLNLGRGFPGVHQNPDMSETNMFPIDTGPNPDRFNHWDELEKLGINFQSADSSVAVGDVDGDGWDDIVMRGEVGIEDGYHGDAVLVWLNDPDGYFTVGPITPIRDLFSMRTLNIGLVDADHDGDLDLVSVGDEDIEDGLVLGVHLNDGTGAFVLDREIPIHDVFGGVPYWLTVEDLDGDGFEDVMVLLQDTSNLHEVAVVYGSPAGLALEPVYLVGGNAAEVLAVDLDGNGLRDVLTCSYQSGRDGSAKSSVSILFQVEPRVFLPMVSIDDLDLSGVNVADMNRDGVLDLIACSNRTSGPDIDSVVRVFYSVPGVCLADLNLDKQLDFFDISLFIKMLNERRPLADLSGDGAFDVQDLIAFLEAFGDGCIGSE